MPTPTPIALAEARANGASHYFTGKPCANGHYSTRLTETGRCVECSRLWDKARNYKRRAETKTPEIRIEERRRQVKYHYGLTADQLKVLHEEQNNSCAICLKPFDKTPCVDHCHDTGKVRGLLCRACNTGIGQLGDDPKRLLRAVDYLKRGAETTPCASDPTDQAASRGCEHPPAWP